MFKNKKQMDEIHRRRVHVVHVPSIYYQKWKILHFLEAGAETEAGTATAVQSPQDAGHASLTTWPLSSLSQYLFFLI